jgi:hypothetical protein
MPAGEGSSTRAFSGVLSGVLALAIMAAYLVASWNHCSLDVKPLPGGQTGAIPVAVLALMYYISTLRAPVQRPGLAAIPVEIRQRVRDQPLQSLLVFLAGTFTAALPFLLVVVYRVLPEGVVPLLLAGAVVLLAEAAVALRWLRQDVRRTHEQGLSGFLWPLHVPAIYWVWACGLGATVVIETAALLIATPT